MADQKPVGDRRRSWESWFKIEPDFKQRQIFRLLGLTALNVTVSTVAFVGFMHHELGVMRAGLPFLDAPTPSLVRIGIVWAALMAGLGGIFAMLTGLMMTHRMAGPIYCFKRELSRIEQGLPPRRIGVRKGDEFKEVADALNGALEVLAARTRDVSESGELALDLERVRAAHQEILGGLDAIDASSLPEALRSRLDGWRQQMRALRDKLER